MALAVIVENAGFGAVSAAPIARRVLDYLLMDIYPSEEDIVLVQQGKAAAPVGTPRRVADVPLPRATDVFGAEPPRLVGSAPASASAPSSVASSPSAPAPAPVPAPAPAPSVPAAPPPAAVNASSPRVQP